jgi:hypothetical protein
MELSEVKITYLKRTNVLEGKQGYGGIERELLVPRNQPGSMIWRQPESWDLRKARV